MEKIDVVESSFWDFKGQGDYTDRKLLMASPFPVAFVLIAYLWFVLKFGPEVMKKRKPFHLGNCIAAYNVVQVAISVYIFQMGCFYIFNYGMYNSTCYSERADLTMQVLDGSHYYFLAKVVELFDTIFFVLRKKQRQVSFLHVYHHTIMVIATWAVVKYSNTDSTVFIGTINSMVHIVMYTYYGLSVFPALTKYLWWKKYITILQLIQFLLMFLHIVINHYVSECKPAYPLLFTVCINTVLFMYLFGDFYIKSYNTKSKRNVDQVKVKSLNGDAKNGLNYLMNHHKLAAKMN